jgi:hypothetical protein
VSTTVDDPDNAVGSFSSIAVDAAGIPVISHYDANAGALRVTKCSNAACSAGSISTNVYDIANVVGLEPSIALGADGFPVISHRDGSAGTLRVTKCGNAACTADNVTTVVDGPPYPVGQDSSIAVPADGRPVISHSDGNANGLRVTKCGNPSCTAGNVSTTVDAPGNLTVGRYSSLAIGADGLPIISHADTAGFAIRVTKCGNAACTAGNVTTTVDDPEGMAGSYSSIAIGPDGLPLVSHYYLSEGSLRVTKCGNASCTAGNVSTVVDDPGNQVGLFPSMAFGPDGLPVISHLDNTASSLRVTKCANTACR